MNNAKSTIFKRGIQISIYTLIQYFEYTYYLILLHACYNKKCLSVRQFLVLTHGHHKSAKF